MKNVFQIFDSRRFFLLLCVGVVVFFVFFVCLFLIKKNTQFILDLFVLYSCFFSENNLMFFGFFLSHCQKPNKCVVFHIKKIKTGKYEY